MNAEHFEVLFIGAGLSGIARRATLGKNVQEGTSPYSKPDCIGAAVIDLLPLAAAREVHTRIDAGGLGGKIVLLPWPEV